MTPSVTLYRPIEVGVVYRPIEVGVALASVPRRALSVGVDRAWLLETDLRRRLPRQAGGARGSEYVEERSTRRGEGGARASRGSRRCA